MLTLLDSNMFRSKYTPLWQNSLQKYLGIDYDSMPINPVIFQTVVGWSELIICFLFCVSILGDVAGFRNLTFIGASLATILMIGAACTDYLLYNDCVSKSFNSDKCKFEQMSSILLGINLLLALIRFPFKSKRKTN